MKAKKEEIGVQEEARKEGCEREAERESARKMLKGEV